MRETEIKIECAVLRRVSVPMREPFRISNGVVHEKESIIVELHSDSFIGYGEASPMSGSFYSVETPETTWQALTQGLVPDILTRTIQNPVEYANVLDAYIKEPFARAGIEGAVWDLTAKKLGTSLNELFRAPKGRIASGLAIGIYDSIDKLLAAIARYLPDGYQRLKIKIAPGWDIEPLTAVRKRFGNIPLMVDANAAYNLREHREILRSLDAFDLMMIEQPLAAGALSDMAELASLLRTPLCADESADSLTALEEIIRLKAASIINIKVQRVGGLWNAKRMHDRAHQTGLQCWLGTMPELGIASTQALSLATLPGFVYPTDIEASSRWFVDDIIRPLIQISNDGFIVSDDSSPMPFSVDRQKLKRYTIETKEFRA